MLWNRNDGRARIRCSPQSGSDPFFRNWSHGPAARCCCSGDGRCLRRLRNSPRGAGSGNGNDSDPKDSAASSSGPRNPGNRCCSCPAVIAADHRSGHGCLTRAPDDTALPPPAAASGAPPPESAAVRGQGHPRQGRSERTVSDTPPVQSAGSCCCCCFWNRIGLDAAAVNPRHPPPASLGKPSWKNSRGDDRKRRRREADGMLPQQQPLH